MKSEHNQKLIHLANLINTLKSNVEREPILRECLNKAFPVADCGKAGFHAVKDHFEATRGTEPHSLMNSVEQTWKTPQLTINIKALREMGVKFIEE